MRLLTIERHSQHQLLAAEVPSSASRTGRTLDFGVPEMLMMRSLAERASVFGEMSRQRTPSEAAATSTAPTASPASAAAAPSARSADKVETAATKAERQSIYSAQYAYLEKAAMPPREEGDDKHPYEHAKAKALAKKQQRGCTALRERRRLPRRTGTRRED